MSRKLGLAAFAVSLLLAGCTSGTHRAVPSDIPEVAQPSGSDSARSQTVAEELDICRAMPAEVISDLVGQVVAKAAAGTAGETLLGECDYSFKSGATPAIKRVYVSARANSDYASLIATGAATPTVVDQVVAYSSPTVGLLVQVPETDYFLQIVVQEPAGSFMESTETAIAQRYIFGE